MAALGTKVPLAGVDPGLGSGGPPPDGGGASGTPKPSGRSCGSPRLFQTAPGYRPEATKGVSPHDGWLQAVSLQVTN